MAVIANLTRFLYVTYWLFWHLHTILLSQLVFKLLKKHLADLDEKITEIAWILLPKVNEPKSIDEQVSIDELYLDPQLYESLSSEKKDLIE